MAQDKNSIFTQFSKLNRQQRLARLIDAGILTIQDAVFLKQSVDEHIDDLVEHFIENTLGCFPMPLGVAINFRINGRDYVIPMVTEETSIVAAASKTSGWLREFGEITTETVGTDIIGQIQIAKVKNLDQLRLFLEENKQKLIADANQLVVPGLVKRGGGVTDFYLRSIARGDGYTMAILHVFMNPCDAMGANLINQVCEYLKGPIEEQTNETVTMCICSNLANHKLTRATITIPRADPEFAEKICEASLFAQLDPYRAATNNKGVLNGMDAVILATGNDWRAVEAGVHAYAAKSGAYRSITQWKMEGRDLVGILEAPIVVGTVGGVTHLHPTADLCMRILGVQNANELAGVIAAVGLVQNLGALRALTSQGIVQGHMRLHIQNLLLASAVKNSEKTSIAQLAEQYFLKNKKITLTDVKNILDNFRKAK